MATKRKPKLSAEDMRALRAQWQACHDEANADGVPWLSDYEGARTSIGYVCIWPDGEVITGDGHYLCNVGDN